MSPSSVVPVLANDRDIGIPEAQLIIDIAQVSLGFTDNRLATICARRSARGGLRVAVVVRLTCLTPYLMFEHLPRLRPRLRPRLPREIPDLSATEQAGGVCRDSDGGVIVNGLFHGIEVKGSCRKGDTRTTFTFKNIRLQGTNWKHLLLVGRVREPTS